MARKSKKVESTVAPSGYLAAIGGHQISVADPDFSGFSHRELAWPLACECRFSNQLPPGNFYSVAQHSLLCVAMYFDDIKDSGPRQPAEWDAALALVIHDMHEGLLRDVSTPLKMHLPGYRELESRFSQAIHTRFGLPEPDASLVKHYDQITLMTEREVYRVDPYGDWSWCKAKSRAKTLTPQMRRIFGLTIGEAALALENFLGYVQHQRGVE